MILIEQRNIYKVISQNWNKCNKWRFTALTKREREDLIWGSTWWRSGATDSFFGRYILSAPFSSPIFQLFWGSSLANIQIEFNQKFKATKMPLGEKQKLSMRGLEHKYNTYVQQVEEQWEKLLVKNCWKCYFANFSLDVHLLKIVFGDHLNMGEIHIYIWYYFTRNCCVE